MLFKADKLRVSRVRPTRLGLPMAAIALAVATFPAALTAAESREPLEVEKEGTDLIFQLEGVARDVHFNADRLDSFSRNVDVSSWTHNEHLNQIKSLVNKGLQPKLTRLVEIQPELPVWQQEGINQMLSAATGLAASTNSAILNRNATGKRPVLLNPEYRELITSINRHAETLVKTSDAMTSFTEARRNALDAGLNVAEY